MISSSHEATPSLLDSCHNGHDRSFPGHNNKCSSRNSTDDATMKTDMNVKANAPIIKMVNNKERSQRPHHSHSPLIRKKKYPTNHKLIPAIPSISGLHSSGRMSPKLQTSSEYRGKMWIRPLTSDPKKHSEYGDSTHFSTSVSAVDPSPVHQAPVSPVLDDEDELMMYTSPCSSDDSYEWHGRSQTGQKKVRITFGQSGKPIKIRSAVGYHRFIGATS